MTAAAERLVAALDALRALERSIDEGCLLAGPAVDATPLQAPLPSPHRPSEAPQPAASTSPDLPSSTGPSQPISLEPPGYAAPTEKALRAQAEARRRRVHSTLQQRTGPAARRPAWVAAEYANQEFSEPLRSCRSQPTESLSPSAREHRQVAARLPAGFASQVAQELAEEQAALGSRLEALAAAAASARVVHTPPVKGRPASASALASTPIHSRHASGSSTGPQGGPKAGFEATLAAWSPFSDGVAAPGMTARQLQTPPTVPRPTAARLEPPPTQRRPAPELGQGQGQGQGSGSAPVTPQAPGFGLAATSGAAAGLEARAMGAGAGTARRRLDFGPAPASLGPSTSWPHGPPAGFERSGVAAVTRGAVSPAEAAAEALAEARRHAAAGNAVGSAAALGALRSMFGAREAAAPGAGPGPGAGEALAAARAPSTSAAAAWSEPVRLLEAGSAHKFADCRFGRGPLAQQAYGSMWKQYEYDASHIGHRERLRAGMADLNAELAANWAAMVAAGAV
ncbi:hypothetical protein HYH03_006559 [Edaphochlamys debaryana]|uniref:Uncharacterized protein n=1 Tax=Edaphochlamys debaryana TaxID=47281 RepID=A0A835Y3I1_9CHLO|nr:hypothetical protein HYH03_006559 [Edaphochlamys debaryana]|eukprot:KAG2495286.1 hypothetical protein HYH03_006559 [Edaphochlamys debaryana]